MSTIKADWIIRFRMIVNSLRLPHSISEIVETFGIHHSPVTRVSGVNLEFLIVMVSTVPKDRYLMILTRERSWNNFSNQQVVQMQVTSTFDTADGYFRCIFGSEFFDFDEIWELKTRHCDSINNATTETTTLLIDSQS